MLTADVKVGTTFELEGKLYQAVEWQHVCQPRLAAFIRGKIKNIETGQVIERNFKTNEKVEAVQVEKRDMQYLYNDGEIYYFMDPETFEQIPVNASDCQRVLDYLMDGLMCSVVTANGKLLSVEPPLFVELEIVECDPAVAGDTAKSAYKSAKVETGKELKVPLFVNNHDRIRIDTRTGEYMERI
ncbi:MAG: elongation factor P [Christensenellales bacterium]